MRITKPYSIPRDWLVFEALLNWNTLDTNDWTKNNWTPTSITYGNTSMGYQGQYAIWSAANIKWNWPSITWNWSFSFMARRTNTCWANATILEIGTVWWSGFWMMIWWSAWGSSVINPWPVEWALDWWVNNSHQAAADYYATNATLVLNKWHHITCTYDWSYVDTYQDNVLVSHIAWSTNPSSSTLVCMFDRRWAAGNYYRWHLQTVRVYNRALNRNEVENLYLEWFWLLWYAWEPQLLDWLTAYYDLNWDFKDIIWWTAATITWTWVYSTDRFWRSNRAYASAGWTSTLISLPTTLWATWTWDFAYVCWYYVWATWSSYPYPLLVSSFNNTSPFLWPTIFFDKNNINWLWDKVIFRIRSTNQQVSSIAASSLLNWWHQFWITRVSWVVKWFIDWAEVCSFSDATSIAACQTFKLDNNDANQWLKSDWKVWECMIFQTTWKTPADFKKLYEINKIEYIYPYEKSFPLNLIDWLQIWLTWDSWWIISVNHNKTFTSDDRTADWWTSTVSSWSSTVTWWYWQSIPTDWVWHIYKNYTSIEAWTKIRVRCMESAQSFWWSACWIIFENVFNTPLVGCYMRSYSNWSVPLTFSVYYWWGYTHDFTTGLTYNTWYEIEAEFTWSSYIFRLYAADWTTLLDSFTQSISTKYAIARIQNSVTTSSNRYVDFVNANVYYLDPNAFIDASWNNNNAASTSITNWRSYKHKTMIYNGTSSYQSLLNTLADLFSWTKSYTVCAWVKITNGATWTRVILMTRFNTNPSNSSNLVIQTLTWWWLQVVRQNTWFNDFSTESTQKINDWKWHFITVTYDWANLIWYIDMVNSTSVASAWSAYSSDRCVLWRDTLSALTYFSWEQWDFIVYNKKLSLLEMRMIFYATFKK